MTDSLKEVKPDYLYLILGLLTIPFS
jgi:hypothetical protein